MSNCLSFDRRFCTAPATFRGSRSPHACYPPLPSPNPNASQSLYFLRTSFPRGLRPTNFTVVSRVTESKAADWQVKFVRDFVIDAVLLLVRVILTNNSTN